MTAEGGSPMNARCVIMARAEENMIFVLKRDENLF